MTKKKKNLKIDYVAIAVFQLAKQHYAKCNEFVEALYQHYGITEDEQADADIWDDVIEQYSFEKMERSLKKAIKELRKKSQRGKNE